MTKEAVLIASKDQGQVKGQIRQNAEQAGYWEYRDQAAFLYRWAVLFKGRLLDLVLLTDRGLHRRRLDDGQGEVEGRAGPFLTGRMHADRAAMQLDQAPADR